MTLANFTPNQPTPAESLNVTRRTESACGLTPVVSATSCSFQLNQLVKQIETVQIREIVGKVFDDLLCLLELLRPIESDLHQVEEAEARFALFQFIHDEASALVKFIQEDALICDTLGEELYDTLDGITFAVSHDLQRVFDPRQGTTEDSSGRVVVGKLFRAHEVLTNCLEQAIISLAIMFDPELVGAKLFNNSDLRQRQSVQLCEDLSTLMKLVDACCETRGAPAFADLIAGIEKFHNESMEHLRYSDWAECESFCKRIQLRPKSLDLEPVFHQFRCYLETLLGQVKMRAVLANVFPIEFGAEDIPQLSSAAQNSFTQSLSSTDFQDDSVTVDDFAIAG